VNAKNGPAGLALAVQHMTAAGVGGLTGTKVGTWLSGTAPISGSAPGMDPQTAYVRARNLLVHEGFTMREAQQIMRAYTGRAV
jgi:hypothetical protein